MAKDAYWFRHDYNSSRTLKMKKLQHIYGLWSTGAYWCVVEVLREQENYKFPCDETSLQMLSEIIGEKDPVKFHNWFNDCVNLELFKKTEKVFFSQILCENMEVWEKKKVSGSQGGRGNKKAKRKLNKSETKANEEENRTEHIKIYKKDFDLVRLKFPGKKLGLDVAFKNFQKHEDWIEVLPSLTDLLQKQIESRAAVVSGGGWVPEWKNFQTWINQRCWEEIAAIPDAKPTIVNGYKSMTKAEVDGLFG